MIARAAVLLAVLAACSTGLAQPPGELDYSLLLLEGGVPVPGGEVVYSMVVAADWWTDAKEPFAVQLNAPAGIEPVSNCTGEIQFNAATRVLTWSDRLDNQVSATKSCPLVFRVDPSLAPGTRFTLLATLTTSSADRNPSNNTASFTGTVLPASDLEVIGDVDIRNYKPGATVTYTFNVTNHGPQDAREVSLTGEISQYASVISFEQTSGPSASVSGANALIPLLRAGEAATFRLVTQTRTDFEAANVRNRVKVRSTSVDFNERNNERDLLTFAGPDADLAVSSSPLSSGAIIRITNRGPDAVSSVTITNSLVGTGGTYEFVENVKFVSATPSQGGCSAAERREIIATPPPPPYWSLDCALGLLAPGAEATIAVVIERKPGSGAFRLYSTATPVQNDPAVENNTGQIAFENVAARRRAAAK